MQLQLIPARQWQHLAGGQESSACTDTHTDCVQGLCLCVCGELYNQLRQIWATVCAVCVCLCAVQGVGPSCCHPGKPSPPDPRGLTRLPPHSTLGNGNLAELNNLLHNCENKWLRPVFPFYLGIKGSTISSISTTRKHKIKIFLKRKCDNLVNQTKKKSAGHFNCKKCAAVCLCLCRGSNMKDFGTADGSCYQASAGFCFCFLWNVRRTFIFNAIETQTTQRLRGFLFDRNIVRELITSPSSAYRDAFALYYDYYYFVSHRFFSFHLIPVSNPVGGAVCSDAVADGNVTAALLLSLRPFY